MSIVKGIACSLVLDEEGRPEWIGVSIGGGNHFHIWRRDNAQSLFDRLAYELRYGKHPGVVAYEEQQRVVPIRPGVKIKGRVKAKSSSTPPPATLAGLGAKPSLPLSLKDLKI